MSKVIQRSRQHLKSVQVVQFGSRTSQQIASRVLTRLSGLSVKARFGTFDSRAASDGYGGPGDHAILIFPIRGDERIPEPVEAWIRSMPPGVTHSLWVTGDFRSGEPYDRVAADEATRMLVERGSPGLIPPMLLDTPIPDAALDPIVEEWLAKLVDPTIEMPGLHGQNGAGARVEGSASSSLQLAAIAEDSLRKVLAILPRPPQFELDSDGCCVTLSFSDGAAYERSVLSPLAPLELRRVFELVCGLSRLELFGVPYAGLRTLDIELPSSVSKIDLRGNRLADLGFVVRPGGVAFLNLADCDLVEVPEFLAGLQHIHTIVLGKNRITSIPRWFRELSSLRRLTTYRNQLTEIPGLSSLPNLELLNIGASPLSLSDDDLRELPRLEVLGVRLLDLKEIHPSIYELPSLRVVDISKNPIADGSMPHHPSIRFVDRMPLWTWDCPQESPA